jgi:hypothetical protein
VADTKRKFVEAYKFPIPAVYGNVIQELLVTQHLARYNTNYAYSPVRFCTSARGRAWARGGLHTGGALARATPRRAAATVAAWRQLARAPRVCRLRGAWCLVRATLGR